MKSCLLGWALLISASAAASEPAALALSKPLSELVFSQRGELHIVGVDQDDDQQLRWLTWGERSEQGSVARLALAGQSNGVSRILSAVERKDAYAPSIGQNVPWRYGQHRILAWTYQYGAAVQVLELYGLDAQNRQQKLAELSGMAIEWSISPQGQTLVKVYARGKGAGMVASCHAWQEQQHTLRAVACR